MNDTGDPDADPLAGGSIGALLGPAPGTLPGGPLPNTTPATGTPLPGGPLPGGAARSDGSGVRYAPGSGPGTAHAGTPASDGAGVRYAPAAGQGPNGPTGPVSGGAVPGGAAPSDGSGIRYAPAAGQGPNGPSGAVSGGAAPSDGSGVRYAPGAGAGGGAHGAGAGLGGAVLGRAQALAGAGGADASDGAGVPYAPGQGSGAATPATQRSTPRSASPLGTALWGRAEQQDFRSRVRGALLGAALGDSLGAPLAGLSPDAVRAAHGPLGLTGPAPAHGRRGAVTAVTQLTLFTVDGLIRAHVRRDTGAWHPPTDVHRAYLRWAATQHDWGPDERRKDNGWLAQQEWLYARRAPDRSCLTGFADETLGTLDHPKNPAARDAAAAARSAPFGLLVGWEPALVLQLAVECAAQSHGHPTGYLTAGAFAVIVHALTRGDSLDAAVQRSLGLLGVRPGHQPVTDALQRALAAVTQAPPGPETVEALATGHGEAALAVAVYCALVAEDIPHGLRLAVNHGGDSTAAGALCGALLGALHGETALPAGWLAELEGRAAVLEAADDLALELTQGPSLHGPTASGPGWLVRYPAG